jgi:two-component system sensor histidine kinase YesM
MVPKLMLQPLLENVIEHALGRSPVTVRLYTRIEAEHLLIYVQDDGVGMSEERREQVERHMYAVREEMSDRRRFGEKRKGFALRNVHWRLYLLYGEGCGLFIDKSVAAGTAFYLRLPLLYEEETSS